MKLSRKNGWSNLARTAAVLAMCFAGATGMTSCGKKAPPPKPAPPPPPPPAPEVVEVSFDTISQDMKADARVQFAPDLKLEDEEVARAIVTLADAWAKGDTEALSRVMSKSTKAAIEGVQELGGFAGDNQPEAVRVVFVAKNDDSSGLKVSVEDLIKSLSSAEDAPSVRVPEVVVARIAGIIAGALSSEPGFDASALAPPMTPEKAAKLSEAWEKLRGDASKADKVALVQTALAESTSVPGLKSAEYMALLAVQTPKGVELTGWGLEKAFGKWTFTNASTDEQVKKSASEWDGVGLAGFSKDSTTGMRIAAPAKSEDENADEGTEDSATEEKKDDSEQQKGPDEKRTPHGPVKIPGGG